MTNLQQLDDNLTAATGPDRKLDRAVFLTLGLPDWEIETARQMVSDGRGDEYLPTGDDRRLRADCVASTRIYPQVSGSIDAALKLVELRFPLPKWVYSVWKSRLSGVFQAEIRDYDHHFLRDAATTPLAILRALVAALIMQKESADA